MIVPLLEVIALDVVDARGARDGGADRIELVSEMAAAGLSPAPGTVAAVLAAVALPVRVMLRRSAGFAAGDLGALRRTAEELRSAGADQFVLGFLDRDGAVDVAAVLEIVDVLDGALWTFHRAIDHAADRTAAWDALAGLPGLDTVLTSGDPDGLPAGLATILDEATAVATTAASTAASTAATTTATTAAATTAAAAGTVTAPHGARGRPRLLVGGGLRDEHIDPLLAAGVTAFHSGTAVRRGRDWAEPVDPALVERLRARLTRAAR